MRKLPFIFYLFISIPFIFFSSCRKEFKAQCKRIKATRIFANTPLYVGDKLIISAAEVGGNRIYKITGPNGFDREGPEIIINNVQLEYKGVYEMFLYSTEGEICELFDTVFVNVLLRQDQPNCSPAQNKLNINSDEYEFTSVTNVFNDNLKQYSLTAINSQISFAVLFHPYFSNSSYPEIGMYDTHEGVQMTLTDKNYNKVHISFTLGNETYIASSSQPVYVYQQSGKMKVTFCNLQFFSENNTLTLSGELLEN